MISNSNPNFDCIDVDFCKASVKRLKEQPPINLFFNKRKPEDEPKPEEREVKRMVWNTRCVGLNDESWPRPKATYRIIDCIIGSPSRYHGGPRRDILCRQLFKGRSEDLLSDEEKNQLTQARQSRATWRIERDTAIKSIYSVKCLQMIHRVAGGEHAICSECLSLKADSSLKYALNQSYALPENRKHTRKLYLSDDVYQTARLTYPGLDSAATSLEKASRLGDQEFWHVFSSRSLARDFNHLHAFKGLIKAVAIRAERTAAGKGMTGTVFQSYFDNFVLTLGAISPRAANLFTENFAGRSLRSARMIRAKTGIHLVDGLAVENFMRIVNHLKLLNYTGPLAVGTDETKCIESLRVHNNLLVGAQGGDITFSSTEELENISKDIVKNKKLCSKV